MIDSVAQSIPKAAKLEFGYSCNLFLSFFAIGKRQSQRQKENKPNHVY
jgi:hypothetical protein